ncbi:MmgE/PrpD family protein [Halosegnis sp.]|uniref:MmgE/PrpD family protein n=1 Tax=Halosegnis sp. TaxID=2864959 RepID=UPI0035D4E8B0
MATPTDRLVERCVTATAPTGAVRDRLGRHLLDTVGVALGAGAHADSTPTFEAAAKTLADGAAGPATVWTTGERRPAGVAALVNGALAHSLDFDDTHRESSLHPGAPVVPAALAVAEREDASVARLFTAIDAGYDVACAVGEAVGPDAHYDRGFHGTATAGTFGATAAAGIVAGLDREQFAAAFGTNGSQAAGSLQFLANGAWNKRLHPGLAARRGITAVDLATAGFEGATEPLAGDDGLLYAYSGDPDPAAVATVAESHAVTETSLKPYPCCRYTHPALDALVDIAGTVDTTAVESIRVELPQPGVRLTGDPIEAKRRPDNFVDCQFSMPYGAAVALTTGQAGFGAYHGCLDQLDDPAFRRLLDATEVTTTPAVAEPFPERWAARVVVAADEHHERFVDIARGDPERPLDWAAVETKVHDVASHLPRATRDHLVAAARDPASVDALVTPMRADVQAADD